MILIGNLFFIFIFYKKIIILFLSTFILKINCITSIAFNQNINLNLRSNCITTRTVNENINMNNCLISIISSTQNGGAICIISLLSLSIEDSTFYQCISTSGNGGAI